MVCCDGTSSSEYPGEEKSPLTNVSRISRAIIKSHGSYRQIVLYSPGIGTDERDPFNSMNQGLDVKGTTEDDPALEEQVHRLASLRQLTTQQNIRAMYKRNNIHMREHQVKPFEAIDEVDKVVYIAGTGGRKSVAFTLPAYVQPDGTNRTEFHADLEAKASFNTASDSDSDIKVADDDTGDSDEGGGVAESSRSQEFDTASNSIPGYRGRSAHRDAKPEYWKAIQNRKAQLRTPEATCPIKEYEKRLPLFTTPSQAIAAAGNLLVDEFGLYWASIFLLKRIGTIQQSIKVNDDVTYEKVSAQWFTYSVIYEVVKAL
ncbi:hypothetical protein F4680DRAFT_467077 [Xylaria scruposa]|nr:hypothetical protein F4680DRAFT_467077 [Xylaria scruposa]